MMLCKNCNVPMVGVMSFSKEKHEKFCKCPKCNKETIHKKIDPGQLTFEETLSNISSKNKKHT